MYRVLIVEDEFWIRSKMVEMVESIGHGFQVVGEAPDGEEAWNAIHELWPMIVITDIRMPKQDGLTLIRNISENQLPIVPIIVSGYEDFQYAQQAIHFNVSEYLLKPVMENEMKAALHRSLDRLFVNKSMHEHLLLIQQFIDDMYTLSQQKLLHETRRTVLSIWRLKACNPALRMNLLRIFSTKLSGLLREVARQERFPQSGSETEEAVLRHFLSLMELWIRQTSEQEATVKKVVKRACDHLKLNYMHNLTVQELADFSYLSVSYFSAQFKQYTGYSFVNYMNVLRIEHSKELLLEPDLKIYEIAEIVGFIALPYFNRLFKQYVGMSPNEYRKSMGL